MQLKYEELVKDHWERLNSKLRNFSSDAGPEFLDMWVPDEDHDKCLFGIFEAALNADIDELSVEIKSDTAKNTHQEWLQAQLGLMGKASIAKKGSGIVWKVVFDPKAKGKFKKEIKATKTDGVKKISGSAQTLPDVPKKPDPEKIHAIYKAKADARLKKIRFEGISLAAANGQTLYEASLDGATLSALIDAKGIIIQAAHRGAKGYYKVLLDLLCELIAGRPIQEGHNHAIIYIAQALQDESASRPLPGLVTAENTEAAFLIPNQLIRKMYKDFVKNSGAKTEWNFWDDRPRDAWLKLSKEEKTKKVQAALRNNAKEFGIKEETLEVADVVGHIRIFLAYNHETIKLEFARCMIGLEKKVKQALEPKLELHLESLEDRNKRDSRSGRAQFQEIPLNE